MHAMIIEGSWYFISLGIKKHCEVMFMYPCKNNMSTCYFFMEVNALYLNSFWFFIGMQYNIWIFYTSSTRLYNLSKRLYITHITLTVNKINEKTVSYKCNKPRWVRFYVCMYLLNCKQFMFLSTIFSCGWVWFKIFEYGIKAARFIIIFVRTTVILKIQWRKYLC